MSAARSSTRAARASGPGPEVMTLMMPERKPDRWTLVEPGHNSDLGLLATETLGRLPNTADHVDLCQRQYRAPCEALPSRRAAAGQMPASVQVRAQWRARSRQRLSTRIRSGSVGPWRAPILPAAVVGSGGPPSPIPEKPSAPELPTRHESRPPGPNQSKSAGHSRRHRPTSPSTTVRDLVTPRASRRSPVRLPAVLVHDQHIGGAAVGAGFVFRAGGADQRPTTTHPTSPGQLTESVRWTQAERAQSRAVERPRRATSTSALLLDHSPVA